MAKKEDKTNVQRLLTQKKIEYVTHEYEADSETTGEEIAASLGEDAAKVFKTLVTIGKTGNHYVFMVPVCGELDLKKAAKAVGEKNIEMIKAKDLLPLTGYVHGGCSPLGMKKAFPTFFDRSAEDKPLFCVSAGKRGAQVELEPRALASLVGAAFVPLTV